MTTVAVLGGGVAGLSAAHELGERGFEVTVYEQRDAPGGKARSIPYAGTGTGGRADLPGEHGFRFFPGFYRHLPDTMATHPAPAAARWRDHLVGATRILFAQAGGPNEIIAPGRTCPSRWRTSRVLGRFLREAATAGRRPAARVRAARRAAADAAHELRRAPRASSGTAELVGVHAAPSSAARRSSRFLADGLTRTLVAARGARDERPHRRPDPDAAASGPLARRRARDRVLDAPTSEVWIDPWVAHLRARGVELRLGEPVEALQLARRADRRRDIAGRRRDAPTTTSRRCRSRSCASSPRRRCAPPAAAERGSTGSSRAG